MKQYNVLTFVGDFYTSPEPIIVDAENEAEARSKATTLAKARQNAEIKRDRDFRASVPASQRIGTHWNQPDGYCRAGGIRIHSVWLTFGQT